MTSACPSCRPSGSNTIRATMSIVLPAENGMITRIGLAGQLCARVTRGSAGVMAAAAMSCRWRRRVCFTDVPPLIGHESKAARASCLTFSLLVVFVCRQSPSAFGSPTLPTPASPHPACRASADTSADARGPCLLLWNIALELLETDRVDESRPARDVVLD